ncbi:MAG TPA: phosphoribosylformylglycinamidine cyclo-ligase [Nocardioidaceae bacterium]|nr:phosphoribosylformylglycinamidine cyclo-ligase [Nocardioidaceae bacterium]
MTQSPASPHTSVEVPADDSASRYAEAGVSLAAGDRAVALMREWVDKARRPEVVGGIGGFAGLFDASALRGYRRPLLATSADGVGTKVAIAQQLDKHDTIGFDLVGMLVDDLVVCGAEPLFMTDYIACGKVFPERIAAVVQGVAEACVVSGCALLGGETAEHPGLLGEHEYDLAGSTTGVVEADELLGPDRVRSGDVLIALRSSGLHSNGYSLVRHAIVDHGGWSLDRHVDTFGRSLGEELLEPTRIYALDCLALARGTATHAMAHITGGGLAANVQRVLPATLSAVVDRSTWAPQPIFAFLRDAGSLDVTQLESTFNLGVGMVALTAPGDADRALALLTARGLDAWVCGEVTPTPGGTVALSGHYQDW